LADVEVTSAFFPRSSSALPKVKRISMIYLSLEEIGSSSAPHIIDFPVVQNGSGELRMAIRPQGRRPQLDLGSDRAGIQTIDFKIDTLT
jgi:hypothetical protein